MPLDFSKPVITPDDQKPAPMPNKGFPYDKLADNRRFEELIYSLYRKEIDSSAYADRYDDINLLQGVRERGRDCSLHLKGRCVGIIQCKHSINSSGRIGKPECAREIIKFVLHGIQDPKLICDPDNFDYHFAVSYGFTEPAKDLFDNFNVAILAEPELQNWTELVIKGNEGLDQLIFAEIEGDLKRILGSINLIKVLPRDLDLLVNKPGNEDIITTFFEPMRVIDLKSFKNSIQHVEETIRQTTAYSNESAIPVPILIKHLDTASFHLANAASEFEGITDSHIARKETEQLYQWIKTPVPVKEQPIILLAGNAGTGKTVVLKDLMIQLTRENIPTLGLKADRYYVDSIADLASRLGLEDSIEKTICTLQASYERVVILIDQLDALSQSLSAKRDYLDTFNLLVRKLSAMNNVRIIISVRIYDLNYDPDLKFYNNQRKIIIEPLALTDVLQMLRKIAVPDGACTGALLELLRIPHHLNVFCKIYHSGVNLQTIHTLHDLYDELWSQKIHQCPTAASLSPEICKNTLYQIAAKMNEVQRISITGKEIQVEPFKGLAYLNSNHILLSEGKEIQFFHQTFYDYVFARQFIESGKDILQYVIENDQGLFIRSSLKMLMVFIRQEDHSKYIKILEIILFSGKFRFHLKLLAINNLAFIETPFDAEIQLVQDKVLSVTSSAIYFIESLNSAFWLKLMIDKGILSSMLHVGYAPFRKRLEKILSKSKSLRSLADHFRYKSFDTAQRTNKNAVFELLSRNLPANRHLVIPYLLTTNDFDRDERVVIRLLYFLKNWDLPEGFQLFEKYAKHFDEDRFAFYKILEDAADYDIDWVLATYRDKLVMRLAPLTLSDAGQCKFDYDDKELLSRIVGANLVKGFELALFLTEEFIRISRIFSSQSDICEDLAFWLYDDDKEFNSEGPHAILHIMIDALKSIAIEHPVYFNGFLKKYTDTHSATILVALCQVLNKEPAKYLNEIVQLAAVIQRKKGFNQDGKYQYWLRKLISGTYSLMNADQKDVIDQIYISITTDNDKEVRTDPNGKKSHRLKYAGHTRYLYISSLPHAEFVPQSEVWKEYQRLQRKFPDLVIRDVEPNKIRVSGVPAPFSEETYKKMDFNSWKSSFLAYHTDSFDQKGNMLEHSRSFSKEVKARPGEFADLVEQLIDENQVPGDYIVKGVEGLVESKFDSKRLLKIYKKAIKVSFSRENTLYLIWKSDYFIQSKVMDEELLTFLIDMATTHPDPELEKDGSLQHAINTVRGAAAHRIVECYFMSDFKEIIFSALNSVAEDRSIAVRQSILPNLAFLNYLDQERALSLFLKITDSDQIQVFKQSIIALQYFINYDFKRLVPYIKKLITIPDLQKDMGTVLAVAWISGKPESLPLLNQVLGNSKEAQKSAVQVATHNIFDQETQAQDRSKKIFIQFLNTDVQEVIHEYSIFFLKLDKERFDILLPLIKKYSRSIAARRDPNYFYQYLIKCAKKHPRDCIDLLAHWETYDQPDITKSGHYEHEPVDLIIACYNSLRYTKKEKGYREKSLDIFDKMLLNSRFRVSANRVIQQVEQ